MNISKQIRCINQNWRLLFIVIIIAASLIISSCSNMRSIRTGSNIKSSNQKIKTKSDDDKDLNPDEYLSDSKQYQNSNQNNGDLLKDRVGVDTQKKDNLNNKNEFTLKSDQSNNDDKSVIDIAGKRLPTIREQLNSVAEEQVVIRNDINTLRKDVDEIKTILLSLTDEFKKGLSKSKLTKKNQNEIENQTYIYDDELPSIAGSSDNSGLLLSDEEAGVQKQINRDKTNQKNLAKNYSTQKIKSKVQIEKSKKSEIKSKKSNSNSNKANDNAPSDNSIANQTIANPDINSAIEDYNSKNYNSAIKKLTDIIKTEKGIVAQTQSNYWLGESFYAIKQYLEAVRYYKFVAEKGSGEMKDNAQVMIAECYIRSGEIPKAKLAFEALIEKYPGSEFVPKARKMLQQL